MLDALLEDPNACAICSHVVSGKVGGEQQNVPVYFCPECFETYKNAILSRDEWVMVLLRMEKARRKKRNRILNSVGLPVMRSLYQGVPL